MQQHISTIRYFTPMRCNCTEARQLLRISHNIFLQNLGLNGNSRADLNFPRDLGLKGYFGADLKIPARFRVEGKVGALHFTVELQKTVVE